MFGKGGTARRGGGSSHTGRLKTAQLVFSYLEHPSMDGGGGELPVKQAPQAFPYHGLPSMHIYALRGGGEGSRRKPRLVHGGIILMYDLSRGHNESKRR